jgi:hypothetical protein
MLALLFIRETRDVSLHDLDHVELGVRALTPTSNA